MTSSNTDRLLDKILEPIVEKDHLISQARLAFTDYLASYVMALNEPVIREYGQAYHRDQSPVQAIQTDYQLTPEEAALFYGFAAHYLDIDDVHPHVQGHPSAVIFSALLATVESHDRWDDFFESYVIGLEVEGLLGQVMNPHLKKTGWHATSVLGVIAAAAAIGRFKQYPRQKLNRLLSIAATQSMGMAFQFGSDIKPLHAGLAAKQAVFTHELVSRTQISANTDPFSKEGGWFAALLDKPVELDFNNWLAPGQILEPGLWFKRHPFCSAAMTGHDAAELIVQQGGKMADLEEVIIHFSPNQDRALRYSEIKTPMEGKFSIEYVVWQVLTYGKIQSHLFEGKTVPAAYHKDLQRIKRRHDLPDQPPTGRKVTITAQRKNGSQLTATVDIPKGAPQNPFSLQDLIGKINNAHLEDWLTNLYSQPLSTNGLVKSAIMR